MVQNNATSDYNSLPNDLAVRLPNPDFDDYAVTLTGAHRESFWRFDGHPYADAK
jgi:hypothetical protein